MFVGRKKKIRKWEEEEEDLGYCCPITVEKVNMLFTKPQLQARIKVFQNFIPNTCILCGVNRIFGGKKEVYSTGQMKLAEKDTTNQHF